MNRFIIFISLLVFINLYSEDRYTAKEFYVKADSIASQFLFSPCPADIVSTDVDSTGRSTYWIYKYDSLNIYFSLDSVSIKPSNLYMATGWAIIGDIWIDSDSALSIAELHGGREFRKKHGNVKIKAWITCSSGAPGNPEWVITYFPPAPSDRPWEISIRARDGSVMDIIDLIEKRSNSQMTFSLQQNYPNPFNPSTTMHFTLQKSCSVSLKIYDLLGKEIDNLISEKKQPGEYAVEWTAKDLPAGMYLSRLEAGDDVVMKKMILQK